MTKSIINFLLTSFICLLLSISCSNQNIIFQDATEIPTYGWDKANSIDFSYNISDTASMYDIIIDLRNDVTYKNQNFWLFVKLSSPDSMVYMDTLECVLADNYGKWIGEGSGSLRHLPVSFLKDVKFSKNGYYKLQLIQGMRYDTLIGIHDIGVRIIKNEEDKK